MSALVALDVHYQPDAAVVACVGFSRWTDAAPQLERVQVVPGAPPPYQPGAFYLRELPYLVRMLGSLEVRPQLAIVDGYVTLGEGRDGLGAHLHRAMNGELAVVGVAKTAFRSATEGVEVVRGQSRRPLYVTAAGIPLEEAARGVAAMHGEHRIPTLLARVDRLCRQGGR